MCIRDRYQRRVRGVHSCNMDNCVCITEWLNRMQSLLQSINGQQACTSEQCFTNEFGGQSRGGELSPEDTVALVPFVIMLVVFLVLSVRHFSNRTSHHERYLAST
eukprot:TRINITY_DN16337_c0_g1_i5.p1 TRINITY_DN16337_c0_g1~~TRINITY_DN16337_c0_g1_i5.p1  ORF type:complete len:105 (-),score=27.36 TRINITY_DN16337_c0_g1_i5:291-605(-)